MNGCLQQSTYNEFREPSCGDQGGNRYRISFSASQRCSPLSWLALVGHLGRLIKALMLLSTLFISVIILLGRRHHNITLWSLTCLSLSHAKARVHKRVGPLVLCSVMSTPPQRQEVRFMAVLVMRNGACDCGIERINFLIIYYFNYTVTDEGVHINKAGSILGRVRTIGWLGNFA